MPAYVELHCHSNYSLLDGASHPEELVGRAVELGYPALALTDHQGLYGAVRFHGAARAAGLKPIVGCEMELDDGSHIVLLATSLDGYSTLCQLVSRAQLAGSKGSAPLARDLLLENHRDLIALSGCSRGVLARPLLAGDAARARQEVRTWADAFGKDSFFVELQSHHLPEDGWRNAALSALARETGLRTVATNDVHYASPDRAPLQDVLVCIRHRTDLDHSAGLRRPNHHFHLKSSRTMAGIFADHPQAVRQTLEIAERCQLSLDFGAHRFPGFKVPEGETAYSYLYRLCQEGARRRYHPITPKVAAQLQHELEVIERTRLAEFFLINWDLMRFAQEHAIPGQGRGSAADSVVAYVLGITKVDPIRHDLLFERFLHEEMVGMPDIDIDFSTEHREQVIQYVYEKYGADYSGMVCNVVTFRPRSSVRDIGKALGFPAGVIDRVAKSLDSYNLVEADLSAHLPEGGEHELRPHPDPGVVIRDAPLSESMLPEEVRGALPAGPWRHLHDLCQQIAGFPRHLSIHVGGMLITARPLIELVPLERATMPGRVVVQFNKDDVEDLGLVKMDMLGLRTLSVVAECLDWIEQHTGHRPDLDASDLGDPEVYDMICAADTVGVFQIESRAQMQTLPRSQPRCFDDLVVEVAIIRPGPIQGDAVHPYLRRKQGREPVTYLHPALEPILKETLGVVLFQEQILRIAMAVAGFSAGESDLFRRAMNRHRSHVEMAAIRDKFMDGCRKNGIDDLIATEIFEKLAGFAEFGFCKSHAAAFAKVSYDTAWLKLRHPAPFYMALLNNQPMGFYSPAVLVGDARRHGLRVLGVDVNRSRERCTVELGPEGPTLRLGFRYVSGLGKEAGRRLEEAQSRAAFSNLEDLVARAHLDRDALEALVLAGGADALHPESNRRSLAWRARELADDVMAERALELSQSALAQVELPAPSALEETADDYAFLGIPLRSHFTAHYRTWMEQRGGVDSRALSCLPDGSRVRIGGLVVSRQQPGTAKGFRFFTLEDEWRLINLIIRPQLYESRRRVANQSAGLWIEGVLQREDGVQSIKLERLAALPNLTPSYGSNAELATPRSRNYR